MKRAIVVGGGLAGLSSAKVLLKHFDEVIILDPDSPKQGNHLHVLLKQGQMTLEKIFPGAIEKMKDMGCTEIDWAGDTIWENASGRFPRYDSSVRTISMGRQYLDNYFRTDLQKNGVKFVPLYLKEILFSGGKVRGIKTDEGDIECSLLILAAGQNFPLESFLGKDIIRSKRIDEVNLTYRSVVLRSEEVHLLNCKQYYYQIDPPRSRIGAVICPIDKSHFVATLIEEEKLPITECRDFSSFIEKSLQLPNRTFYDSIKEVQELTEVRTFRKNTTYFRKLNIKKIPKGLILVGDIVASLNPVFGQGMTLSLLEAELLGLMLESGSLDSDKFHRKSQKLRRSSYFISYVGSKATPFMRIFQKVPYLHQLFLQFLHVRSFTRLCP